MTGRYIGVQHRVKMTAEEEARPTRVCILSGDKTTEFELATEQDELDFAFTLFPVAWRAPESYEDMADFPPHHVKWRTLRKNEKTPTGVHRSQLREGEKGLERAVQVPSRHDGLKEGDIVAMILGGSGDYFAYALARRGEEAGTSVMRIPPFIFAKHRENGNKDKDAQLLAELVRTSPDLFYQVDVRDRALIRVREALIARTDAMKARIACEQRLRQRIIGEVFCQPDGLYPEGGIEKLYDERRANDVIFGALAAEEKRRESELKKALDGLDIYHKLFEPIEGCGPMIAARIISAVIDIRRFEKDAKLKAFCGVHVQNDGRFARRRQGQVANWHPDARQALFLLADQFNRRPNSEWGRYFRQMKQNLRERHPEPVEVESSSGNGKVKRYTDGHIHKMAAWRTLTRFVEWLHGAWWDLERAPWSMVGARRSSPKKAA